METLSHCLFLELEECSALQLDDLEELYNMMREAAHRANASVIQALAHKFKPQGVSVILLIAESEFSIHTYPEKRYCSVILSSCGQKIDLDKAKDYIYKALHFPVLRVQHIWGGLQNDG